MREILFRGKRLDNGEWVEGFLVKHPSAVRIGDYSPWYISVPPKDPDDNGGLYNIIPETVGQFIGRTDDHGKRIYEGDTLVVKRGEAEWGCIVQDIRNLPWVLFGSEVTSVEVIAYTYDTLAAVSGEESHADLHGREP